MKVKELIQHLHSLDPDLEVYITNQEETQLTQIDVVVPCEDDRDEFVAIFPKANSQPQFTLTPEEVADLFEILSTRDNIIDEVLRTTFIDDPYTRGLVDEQKKILPILNRIKQWQDETKI